MEGPTVINTELGWIVYFDKYREHKMGAIRSKDIQHWEDISHKIDFPEGTRHGSVLKVKKSIVDRLLANSKQ